MKIKSSAFSCVLNLLDREPKSPYRIKAKFISHKDNNYLIVYGEVSKILPGGGKEIQSLMCVYDPSVNMVHRVFHSHCGFDTENVSMDDVQAFVFRKMLTKIREVLKIELDDIRAGAEWGFENVNRDFVDVLNSDSHAKVHMIRHGIAAIPIDEFDLHFKEDTGSPLHIFNNLKIQDK